MLIDICSEMVDAQEQRWGEEHPRGHGPLIDEASPDNLASRRGNILVTDRLDEGRRR